MGVMLRELCEDNELIAQSTFFKPKRRKQGAGTHMPFGKKSAGKQSSTIDYLLIDRRWRTCVLGGGAGADGGLGGEVRPAWRRWLCCVR